MARERLERRRLAIYVALRDGGPDADLSDLAIPIGNFWDSVGGLVRAGHIERAVACEALGGPVRLWWSLLEPAARTSRAEFGSGVYEHFEWFAAETDRFLRPRGLTPGEAFDRQRLIATSTQRIAVIQARLAEMEAMRTVTLAPTRPTDVAAPPVTDGAATASG